MTTLDENPQDPFGVLALPTATTPVTAAGLKAARRALLAHFGVADAPAERSGEQQRIGNQLDKAYQLVLDNTRWTIYEDHVAIVNDTGTIYRTRPDFCEGPQRLSRGRPTTICPGFARGAVGCYHLLAVEYVRLAQVLDPTPQSPDAATGDTLVEVAQVTLSGRNLLALTGYIHLVDPAHTEDINVVFSEGASIALYRGDYQVTAPASPNAVAVFALVGSEFADLWSAVRPSAKETPTITLTVLRQSATEGVLTMVGGTLDLAVAITLLGPSRHPLTRIGKRPMCPDVRGYVALPLFSGKEKPHDPVLLHQCPGTERPRYDRQPLPVERSCSSGVENHHRRGPQPNCGRSSGAGPLQRVRRVDLDPAGSADRRWVVSTHGRFWPTCSRLKRPVGLPAPRSRRSTRRSGWPRPSGTLLPPPSVGSSSHVSSNLPPGVGSSLPPCPRACDNAVRSWVWSWTRYRRGSFKPSIPMCATLGRKGSRTGTYPKTVSTSA
ncbi:hypothetical protein HC891_16250 [Candidatus Gracilibacteria bacterium]|nr:hypothetical protein [Candidatus Gracilibacteria bacterium]